jgi:hypothetical protein
MQKRLSSNRQSSTLSPQVHLHDALMIMTTRMFRRETSEQLEISHQPMQDVTLLLFLVRMHLGKPAATPVTGS